MVLRDEFGAWAFIVARVMFLSRHTVQDDRKSIFAKTSVHSRRALLARVVGSA